MVFKQEVNIPLALTIGLISGLLLLVMTFGVQAWYATAEQAELDLKANDGPVSEFVQLKQAQKEKIETLLWTDAGKTSARIKIDRAMELMVQLNGKLPSTQPTTGPTSVPTTAPSVAREASFGDGVEASATTFQGK